MNMDSPGGKKEKSINLPKVVTTSEFELREQGTSWLDVSKRAWKYSIYSSRKTKGSEKLVVPEEIILPDKEEDFSEFDPAVKETRKIFILDSVLHLLFTVHTAAVAYLTSYFTLYILSVLSLVYSALCLSTVQVVTSKRLLPKEKGYSMYCFRYTYIGTKIVALLVILCTIGGIGYWFYLIAMQGPDDTLDDLSLDLTGIALITLIIIPVLIISTFALYCKAYYRCMYTFSPNLMPKVVIKERKRKERGSIKSSNSMHSKITSNTNNNL